MTSKKKRLNFDLECYFCKIEAYTAILRRYSHNFPKFPRRFRPDFHQIKCFEGALAPRLLHQCSKILDGCHGNTIKKYEGFMALLAKKVPDPCSMRIIKVLTENLPVQ